MDISQLKLISEQSRERLIEIICQAKAGHTGGDLSCLNVLTVLYFHTMNLTKDNLDDPSRDRFILSKGHCVEALFVTLESKGILDPAVLDTLGQFNSPLAGHPTINVPGIEVNSGALGHGLPIGVGMALAAKMDGKDYKTFVLMGDGEQGEGSIYEAMMAGRQYKLDNLVAIIDRNHLQISGDTEDVMGIDCIRTKWTAFGWDVIDADGDDIVSLVKAFDGIDYSNGQPHLIISHTTKGKGVSYMENQAGWHGKAPNDEEYAQAMKELDEQLAKYEAEV